MDNLYTPELAINRLGISLFKTIMVKHDWLHLCQRLGDTFSNTTTGTGNSTSVFFKVVKKEEMWHISSLKLT